jgi:Uma2 family endonuclease
MIPMQKYTSTDLELMPDNGSIYEIIEGELFVSRAPSYEHQYTCLQLGFFLVEWNRKSDRGIVLIAPGLVLAQDDDVIPDVVWISRERFADSTDQAGHLIVTPELLIEVLSPGRLNEYRDREAKLDLYSRRGALEYWILDWMTREIEIFRRDGDRLAPAANLSAENQLQSPLLPGFSCRVGDLFFVHAPSSS